LGGFLGSAGWVGLKQRERLEDLVAERARLLSGLEKPGGSEPVEKMKEEHRIAAATVELDDLARRARQMMEAGEDGRIPGLIAAARPAFARFPVAEAHDEYQPARREQAFQRAHITASVRIAQHVKEAGVDCGLEPIDVSGK